jgi:hypothetical protein
MINVDEHKRFDKDMAFFLPFGFLYLDILFGWAWFNFEYGQERENKKEQRVIDWLYPYTYFILSLFTHVLWIILRVHRLVYRESFVDPSWNLFTINSTVFIWFLALVPFYIHDKNYVR